MILTRRGTTFITKTKDDQGKKNIVPTITMFIQLNSILK